MINGQKVTNDDQVTLIIMDIFRVMLVYILKPDSSRPKPMHISFHVNIRFRLTMFLALGCTADDSAA